jgi:catechol-2,3-dioxygenase
MLIALDHVNVRTSNLAAMLQFYTEVVGLNSGPRPESVANGAWLYCSGNPVIHMIERTKESLEGPKLEHFALRGQGLQEMLVSLRRNKIDFRVSANQFLRRASVNFRDPDGNRLHLDFPDSELRSES